MNEIERFMWLRLLDSAWVFVVAMLLALMLVGCSTVEVRAPICEPPPIPADLLVPCFDDDPLIVPADGSFASVYDSYVKNFSGPIARCVRKVDKLQEVVKYRDEVCAKIKADNVTPPKKWWQF